jgi:hypothetical protein
VDPHAPPAGSIVLLDLRLPGEAARLVPVDDVVMGGRSSSRVVSVGEGAAFEGVLSLEDGGGFASVRSAPRPLDLSGRREVVLRVRGDGRRYKLNLRTDTAFDGVTWQAPFTPPAGTWAEVRLPLAAFEPRFRGRPAAAGPLDPSRVATVGLLVSDRQAGAFRLELAWIAAE